MMDSLQNRLLPLPSTAAAIFVLLLVSLADSQNSTCPQSDGAYCRARCPSGYDGINATDCRQSRTELSIPCCIPRCSKVGDCLSPENGECPNNMAEQNYGRSRPQGDCPDDTKCCSNICNSSFNNTFCAKECPDGSTKIYQSRKCPSYAAQCCRPNP